MVKRPIVIASIGYMLGIILGLYFEKSIALIFLGILIIAFLINFLNKNVKRYLKVIFSKKMIFILFVFIIIGAIYSFKLDSRYNKIYGIDKNIEITGVIEAVENKNYSNKYILKVKSIDKKQYANLKLILYVKKNQDILEYGDYIKFIAKYSKPEDSRNYKGFSYRDYLKQNNIYGTVNAVNTIQILEKNETSFIERNINALRNKIIKDINNNLPEDEASVFLGILLGEKSQISDEINTYFKNGNMAHILAISGAHVSYIVVILNLFFGKMQKRFSKICIIIILIFFMMLTNFSPSVVRACLMTISVCFSKLVHRKSDIYNNLSLSALIILFFNPYKLFNIGFELTFLGTLGIVLISPRLFKKENNHIKQNILKNKLKKVIKDSIVISISVQILIAPIIILNFNAISYNFLISGIISTPIFALIMIIGIFFLILSPVRIILYPIIRILVGFLICISKALSNLPFSSITIPTPNLIFIITYYIILFLIFIFQNKLFHRIFKNREKIKRTMKKIIIVIIIISLIFQLFNNFSYKYLQIYFIDVGQGDSSLIITPKHKTILIDGGGSSDKDYDIGKNILVPYLLDRGVWTIDYLMVSHFDNDHCGGLMYLLKTLKIKNILISKQAKVSEEYTKFLEIANEKHITIKVVQKGDVITIEKDLRIYVLYPSYNLEFDDLNNNSLVVKLVYKNFSMLFTGDIEKEAESEILKMYGKNVLKSTVLKIAHHGSKTSSTPEFIKLVNPKIALIGVGKDNNFGHPNEEILERLNSFKVKVFRTDECGEIQIRTNGSDEKKLKIVSKFNNIMD